MTIISQGELELPNFDDICDKCGLCCHRKVILPDLTVGIHPREKCDCLKDDNTCSDYENRKCKNLDFLSWDPVFIPETCKYAPYFKERPSAKILTEEEFDGISKRS